MKRLSIGILLLFATASFSSAAPPPPAPHGTMGPQAAATKYTGTVLETMSTSGYTYVLVDTGREKTWAASPQFTVKTGDRVSFPQGVSMKDYRSKTLDRTFDLVHFVEKITVEGSAAQVEDLPKGHPAVAKKPASAQIDFAGIARPEGGNTVAELFAAKDKFAGKAVSVRGKVVKFNPNIMGKNWIHLRDGSGTKGTNDLTITTSASANIGDTILVNGTLSADKDFGSGYAYDLIIEDAAVIVED